MTESDQSKQSHYKKNSLALIVTVFNEVENIAALLSSYSQQQLLAEEVIIVDAGSTDGTWQLLEHFVQDNPQLNCRLFQQEGNRSQGRNFAVQQSKSEWLAITDAGCRLSPQWLAELRRVQIRQQTRVVAGYYRGWSRTALQEAMIPYFLVMPKRLSHRFLPSTRSMLISRQLWLELGGLAEHLTVSEDYHLAKRLEQRQEPIAFAKKALVYWQPPATLRQFTGKIAAMAANDIRAGIVRPKVLLVYLRYFLLALLLLVAWLSGAVFLWSLLVFLSLLYLAWSIAKNYEYCPKGWPYLPFLQLLADGAVMWGSRRLLSNFSWINQ